MQIDFKFMFAVEDILYLCSAKLHVIVVCSSFSLFCCIKLAAKIVECDREVT